jgi:prevent-host-death family protein
MMVRMMSTHEARANFGDLLGSVYYTGEPVMVARKGRPMAVLVSPADFARLQALDAARADGPDMALRVDVSSGRNEESQQAFGDAQSEDRAERPQFTPAER